MVVQLLVRPAFLDPKQHHSQRAVALGVSAVVVDVSAAESVTLASADRTKYRLDLGLQLLETYLGALFAVVGCDVELLIPEPCEDPALTLAVEVMTPDRVLP